MNTAINYAVGTAEGAPYKGPDSPTQDVSRIVAMLWTAWSEATINPNRKPGTLSAAPQKRDENDKKPDADRKVEGPKKADEDVKPVVAGTDKDVNVNGEMSDGNGKVAAKDES